jgi:hypothetical protein
MRPDLFSESSDPKLLSRPQLLWHEKPLPLSAQDNDSRRVRTDPLLAPNDLVNTSDSGSASDILIHKTKLAVGVFA